MNRKTYIAVLLLTAALLLNACNKQTNDPVNKDSDTAANTPEITETAPDAPTIPVITPTPTEPLPSVTTAPEETELLSEDTEWIPEIPTELPTEETTAEVTESAEPTEPVAPTPVVIAKPTIDITDQLIPGGEPVSGQTVSAQSETLRLVLDYSVKQSEEGTAELTLNVGLSCYELWCSAKNDMGTITVNGVSRTFSTDAINHTEHSKTYIPFLTQTYNATGNQSASIEVSWNFNGSYGGVDIGTLTTGLILVYGTEGAVTVPPTEPVETESSITEPVNPEPILPDPVVTDPVLPEPTVTEPVVTDPVLPDPVIPDSVTAEPSVTEPAVPTEPTEEENPLPPDAFLPDGAGGQ